VICNSTKPLLDDLSYLCYKDERPCEGYQIRARLFLNIGNDPFSWRLDENGNLVPAEIRDVKKFFSFGHCPGKAETRMTEIEFFFNYDEVFDETLLPGLRAVPEWKVEIENAVIEYCDSCYTMNGPLPIFWFRGSLYDVEFVKDTKDELEPYIEVRDTEGNLVADIR
jgi:hypothetical protein